MKIKNINDNLILYINKSLIKINILKKEEVETFIKEVVIKLKKRKYPISGIYKVKVYQNDKYGLIIYMEKEEELDFFKDLIDLKITIYYNCDLYLKIKDYFLIDSYKEKFRIKDEWYLNIKIISEEEMLKLIEHGEITPKIKIT